MKRNGSKYKLFEGSKLFSHSEAQVSFFPRIEGTKQAKIGMKLESQRRLKTGRENPSEGKV
jgi:hypothetical protein